MSKLIQTNVSVVYTDNKENKQTRFMDKGTSHAPVSHSTGQAFLSGGTRDHEIATNVNLCVIHSDGHFSLKVGDTTALEMTNLKFFCYDGDSTTIFVSNRGTDPIILDTTFAKY